MSVLPKGIAFSKEFALGEILVHFHEHQLESKESISFLDFIELHYGGGSDHRKENPDKLPNLDSQFCQSIFLSPEIALNVRLETKVVCFHSQVQFDYSDNYLFDFSYNLFQPPIAA